MLQIKYELNDLTEVEYAAIGRVVRTFGAIEHELMRTIIDASGGPDNACSKQLKKALRGSLKTRLEELIKILNKEQNVVDAVWLKDFEIKLLEGCQVRDHYCHGNWYKDENGDLCCDFYKRTNQKNTTGELGVELHKMPCSLDEIETTFQSNLSNLKTLESLQQLLK